MNFRFDKSLLRTVLFSLAVVTFIIGTYQTVERTDKMALMDNYWLFMLSFSCVLLYRYLGRKPAVQPPVKPEAAKKPARSVPAPRPRGRK